MAAENLQTHMTLTDRINYWLKCRPLAEANQRMWIAAVLADGVRFGAEQIWESVGDFKRHPDVRQIMKNEHEMLLMRAQEMEEAGKI